jgi:hypothetical protein
MPALLTATTPFCNHGQMTIAAAAAMTQQYNLIIKPAGFTEKLMHSLDHLKGTLNDIHSSGVTCSTGFWCLGVNLRLQFLQKRILRIPLNFVVLFPLLTLFVEPQ